MAPLEGLVETDWATSTFTMNWKLTRPGSVRFEAGEVFCMLVPQRRHELESFEPVIAELAENPEANEGYQSWANLRDQLGILHWLSRFGTVEGLEQAEWQKHYFKGLTADGLEAPEHQTTRRLREFRLRGED
jgi:hypothetical protein